MTIASGGHALIDARFWVNREYFVGACVGDATTWVGGHDATQISFSYAICDVCGLCNSLWAVCCRR